MLVIHNFSKQKSLSNTDNIKSALVLLQLDDISFIKLQPVRYWMVGSNPGMFRLDSKLTLSSCTSWNPEGPGSVAMLKLCSPSEDTVASSPKLANWSFGTSIK